MKWPNLRNCSQVLPRVGPDIAAFIGSPELVPNSKAQRLGLTLYDVFSFDLERRLATRDIFSVRRHCVSKINDSRRRVNRLLAPNQAAGASS